MSMCAPATLEDLGGKKEMGSGGGEKPTKRDESGIEGSAGPFPVRAAFTCAEARSGPRGRPRIDPGGEP